MGVAEKQFEIVDVVIDAIKNETIIYVQITSHYGSGYDVTKMNGLWHFSMANGYKTLSSPNSY